jgi:hypothetical protein
MIIVYYISIIINILCILSLLILNYLEYKNILKNKYNKELLITILISGLVFMITRNLI